MIELLFASLVAQIPEGKIIHVPHELDVVVLSKKPPPWLEIVDGRCSLADVEPRTLPGPVTLVSSRRGLVRACAAAPGGRGKRPCFDAASIVLRCSGTATVRGPAIPRRKYGSGLRLRAAGRGLRVVASVPLETYVAGVVLAEIARAPIEARRAQAVLARSFALRALRGPRHDDAALCDLTHCQAFAGAAPPIKPRTGTFNRALVDASDGIADVFFHSTCGGHTVSPREAWGLRTAPEVIGVPDVDASGRAWCRKSPHYRWVHEVSDRAMAAALAPVVSRPLDASTLVLEATNAVGTRWKVGDREGTEPIAGEALHLQLSRALGFSAVKSSLFRVRRAGDQLRLSGQGLGHRVGMCQVGTIARARAGQSSREILLAYFPQLDLARVVEDTP